MILMYLYVQQAYEITSEPIYLSSCHGPEIIYSVRPKISEPIFLDMDASIHEMHLDTPISR
jgi:hypothetical protein